MVDAITKFIRKLSPKQKKRLREVLKKISRDELQGLDIRQLKGHKDWYRCRVGKIRIVFVKTGSGQPVIYQITYRDKAYR